jgi:uncharacterized phiE125 gp8 family phage protein
MSAPAAVEPAVSLSEAQAYVRIETGEEEAVLAGLLRTATAIGESFMNQVIVERDFVLDLPASTQWQQVAVSPVRSIARVEAVDSAGVAAVLPASAFSVDVDASGGGWVRLIASFDTKRPRPVRRQEVPSGPDRQNPARETGPGGRHAAAGRSGCR